MFLLAIPTCYFFKTILNCVIAKFEFLWQTPGREFLLRVSYLEIYNEVRICLMIHQSVLLICMFAVANPVKCLIYI